MAVSNFAIPEEETLGRSELAALQRRKLTAMFRRVLASNHFYQHKFAGIDFDPATDWLEKLPFTTRKELEKDQADHPPYGSNLTSALDRYCRFHQTSGSSGRPMRWLDTAENWEGLKRCWSIIYAAAGVAPDDRIAFTFSFGPFIGFWAAFDGAVARGNLCLPAGGMSTTARLKLICDNQVTVICCTPTYALHMAAVAEEEGIDIASSAVRSLIVAGEPGGSIPSTRQRIESAWNARVFDHTGMTEIGPLGIECLQSPGGVHIIESECIAEVIDPHTQRPVADGQAGELVITNLVRADSPVIRYRTGDQVVVTRNRCPCGRHFARMEGGILGRIDDMFIVRGNNVFPSALEAVIRRHQEVNEYRVEVYDNSALTQVCIEIEPVPAARDNGTLAGRIAGAVQDSLSFRPEVRVVPPGTLPRFEMKARRFSRRPVPDVQTV